MSMIFDSTLPVGGQISAEPFQAKMLFPLSEPPLLVRDSQGGYLPATVDQILAAAREVVEHKMQRGALFTSTTAVRDYLCAKLAGLEHEVFAVLFLDVQNCLIEYTEIFRGTIDSASVYPREVVKEALLHNAAALIFTHNHPSGNPEPSEADKILTKRLKDALQVVDIRVLDHLIVGGNTALSFAERGLI